MKINHAPLFDSLQDTSLLKRFSEIHNSIYANDGLSPQQALDEMLKIMFIKVVDLKRAESQFFITSDEYEQIRANKENNSFLKRITSLFQDTINSFSDVFEKSDTLKLTPNSIAFAVHKLQSLDFSNSKDAKGLAFQKFLAGQEKTGRGQFFTPEPVIDFCVNFLQPKPGETIIDPAAGSGGFLFSAYKYLLDHHKKDKDQIIPALYGIDINKTVVRIAKMKFLLESDQPLNIICQNSLGDLDDLGLSFDQNLENKFDIVLTNPPFGASGKINNDKILTKYELGYKWQGDGKNYFRTKTLHLGQVPEVLFVERCLQLLKEGGRMAIVLPNGHFENSSLEYLRMFIKQKARVLAVVNLPQETFIPFGTGVKTSLLFLRKESKKDMGKEVFFGKVTKLGYLGNKNASPSYLKDEFGNITKTDSGEDIIDEDFSVVLKSYEQFKKNVTIKSSTSFSFPFSELNGRFDFDYYSPQNRDLLNKLKNNKAVRLSDICEVIKSKSKKLSHPNTSVEYVELSDINTHAFEIINSTNYIVHELPSRATYEIKENDIITAVAGNSIGSSKHATALVTKEYEGSVCTNGFRILRNPKIDLYYLLYYLKTDLFLRQVDMYRTGAAIPSISDKDLGNILIHLPNDKAMKTISKKVKESFDLRTKANEQIRHLSLDF